MAHYHSYLLTSDTANFYHSVVTRDLPHRLLGYSSLRNTPTAIVLARARNRCRASRSEPQFPIGCALGLKLGSAACNSSLSATSDTSSKLSIKGCRRRKDRHCRCSLPEGQSWGFWLAPFFVFLPLTLPPSARKIACFELLFAAVLMG